MTYEEKAMALRSAGWNCCQAVLGVCCEDFPLTQDTAFRLGAFFGGGMRRGEVCGAVTGALMGLGLKYGDEDNRTCLKSKAFMEEFTRLHGSLLCRELLDGDDTRKKTLCPALICQCAGYLEKEFSK